MHAPDGKPTYGIRCYCDTGDSIRSILPRAPHSEHKTVARISQVCPRTNLSLRGITNSNPWRSHAYLELAM